MAIRDLRGGQLAILWLAVTAIVAIAHVSYSRWESRFTERVDSNMSLFSSGGRLVAQTYGDKSTRAVADSTAKLMGSLVQETLRDQREHASRRAYTRPALMFVDVGAGLLLLAITWRWFGTRRDATNG